METTRCAEPEAVPALHSVRQYLKVPFEIMVAGINSGDFTRPDTSICIIIIREWAGDNFSPFLTLQQAGKYSIVNKKLRFHMEMYL